MKSKKKLFLPGALLLACVLVLINSGCKKVSDLNPTPKSDVDVYVSGLQDNQAVVWKNGVVAQLPGLPNYSFTYSMNMTSNGSDIYVAGTVSSTATSDDQIPVYWKNGVITGLDVGILGTAQAFAIAVSGNDVYVAGSTNPLPVPNAYAHAVYWKNGVITDLVADPAVYTYAQAWGIAISGTDVYICGSVRKNNTPKSEAVYWKNGVLHEITDGSTVGAIATSIAVKNDQVYVTYFNLVPDGPEGYSWINGVTAPLSDHKSIAGGITANGSDIYIAGDTYPLGASATAVVWKNGIAQNLTGGGTGTAVRALSIFGSDVYAAGWGSTGAVYWKNGVAVQIGAANSSANGIVVVAN